MIQRIKISALVFILCSCQFSFAQIHPDSLPQRDDVVGEILKKAYRTKIPSFIELANDLQTYWDGGSLTSEQQEMIEKTYRSIEQRRLPTHPYLFYLIKTVSNAGGNELIQLGAMTEILSVLQQVYEKEKKENINVFAQNINSFLTNKAIHYSNGYKLLVENIDFSIEYIDRSVPHIIETLPEETIADLTDEKGDLQDSGASGDDWEDTNTSDSWASDDSWTSDDNWASDDSWTSDDNWNNSSDSWDNSTDNWANSDDSWETTSGNPDQGSTGWADEQNTPLQTSNDFSEQDEQFMIDAIVDVPLPVEEGPVIRFENTDLIFVTHYDTIKLTGSKGAYQMVEDMYIGEGGTFYWNVLGLNSEKVYCNLGKYAFSVLRPHFISVKSQLTHNDKLAESIEGTFEYRSENRHPSTKPTFPRFTSYKSDISIDFPADDKLIFKGGFTMIGDKITSKSLLHKESVIEVQGESGILFRATGLEFILSDSLITSQNAEIKLYVGRDSISHPAIKFYYQPASRELMIVKAKGKFQITPYSISYFDIDITADMIEWNLNADSLDISISSAQNIVPAYFESVDYFNKKDMKSLAGIYNFNPLIMAVHYSRKNKKRTFSVYDMALAYKQNEMVVKATMINLLKNGFIDYNENSGMITIRDKAYHYVDANRFEKDYDDLKIKSLSPSAPNATLKIPENELVIRGINRFYVSEILDVFILPENNEITLLKDRDFRFNGQMFAGNFEFIGREFLFDYDSFFVDMTTIDSIRFYIDNLETGQKEMVDNKLVTAGSDTSAQQTMDGLTQEFQESTGRLYINRPDNKSGQKMYPNFPRFNAEKGAIVYFDNKEVLDGAYDKSIYFVIPPFEIDSLSGSDPSSIGFDGTFIAEGILPSFEETLHIMEDNSLGFNHTIAPEGYQLYDGTGRIYNKLQMDKNGLTAQGSISYISSTLDSDNLTIYMDSLTGSGYNFVMMPGEYDGGSFPDASVDQFNLKWLPNKDSMHISNIKEPFSIYNNTATLDGTLTVSKPGGFGKGKLLTRGAEARSENFTFNQQKFGARHAFFEIKSDNPEKPALSGDDILLDFNLAENYADIGPEIEGVAAINFPYAQFKTSISNARWNLDNRTVTMTKPDEVDISNSYFYATREELDSLVFNASKAVYDMDKLELLVSGIPYINVADAKITPENNEVLILENAKIGTLYNTTIVIDTVNEYHRLYDGTINIISRNEFEGSATYQFVNAVNDTFAIKIDEFVLVEEERRSKEGGLHTQAMGYVFEEDGVVISPGMLYKGEAIMYAPDPAFQLNGYVNLVYRPNIDEDIWIRYQSNETETQEVKFDFEKARTENDLPLVAGIHYDEDDRLYATFVNDKKSVMDKDFFIPSGILSYNADSSWYMIEDTSKTSGYSYSGKIFGLNVNTSDMVFEGPVNFNLITDDFKLKGSAIGTGNMGGNEYKMDAFLTMDFDLPSQAVYVMSTDMLEEVDLFGLPVAYRDDPRLLYKASEIIGERATVDYEQKSLEEYTPLISMSSQLMKTLVITKVQLNWSDKNKAWYSTGKIGVANILRDDINALVDGFLEIKKNETGDVINLFLQFSPTCWYYFNFEENRMITSSSNDDYLDIIADKTDALKADFGDYFVLDGEFSEAMRFIDRFRLEYLGIKEPYELEYAPIDQSIPVFEEKEPQDDGFPIPEEVEEEEEDDDGF